jgi:serine/threonine-protein kinase
MAEVFRGRDMRLGREVAIKMLRADLARDPTFLARFEREATSSAALNHPAIVSVYDTGKDLVNGVEIPYIVMEFIEGRTLRDLLQTQGSFPERRAMEITSDVCAALDYSHRMGTIHRDIKPANVMMCPDGSVKVMDFGIARATTATSSTMTATAAVIGTAQYLSPEQARGARVDARSDVYSTGVLFYELLTGQPPFRGDNPVAVAYQHVREHPQPPSYHDRSISAKADAIVFKAMEKDPNDRYTSAGQMRTDLERALAGRSIIAPLGPVGDPSITSMSSGPTGNATQVLPHDYNQSQYQEPYPPTSTYGGTQTSRYDTYGGGGGYDSYQQRDDRYDSPYDDEPAGDERGTRKAWKYVLAALGVILVFVVVYLLATSLLNTSGGDAAEKTATIPPGLVGKQVTVAEAQLADLGFTNVKRKSQESTKEAKDTVLAVDPASGTKIDKTALITLTVAVAPGQVTVPDVVGQTAALAKQRLQELGFNVTTQVFTGATTNRVGTVQQTDPVANTPADKGSLVTISVVSPQAQVPGVTGQPVNTARSTLESYGFRVNVAPTSSPAAAAGTVVSQTPTADTLAARGSQVTVYVSQGQPQPPPTTTQPTPPDQTETTPPESTTPTPSQSSALGLPRFGGRQP